MKVKMKKNLVQISGKMDGLIYYYHSGMNTLLARKKPVMPYQPMNERFKNISKSLKAINPSVGFRQDMGAYLEDLKAQDDELKMLSWHNLYVKMMWNLAAKYPAVDLETLTREQISSEELPCTSVKAAVEAGILPMAGGYRKFTAQI